MSRWNGKMGDNAPKGSDRRNKGVLRNVRAQKRAEAEERNARSAADQFVYPCGHTHGVEAARKCDRLVTMTTPDRSHVA